ncbi:MAG: hypothetical protein ACRYHQ_35710, partial [Janthinobacterium lividum]
LYALRGPGLDGVPPGVQSRLLPVPADAAFLVEVLDGSTARITLSAIAEYLAGILPALPGLQFSPVWGAPK